jgi:hypothetical protein
LSGAKRASSTYEWVTDEVVTAIEQDIPWLIARIKELEEAANAFVDTWYEDLGGDMTCIPAREFAALERVLGRTPTGMMTYFDSVSDEGEA